MNNYRRTVIKGLAASGWALQGLVYSGTSFASGTVHKSKLKSTDLNRLVITSPDRSRFISSSFIAGVKATRPGSYIELSLDDLSDTEQRIFSRGKYFKSEGPVSVVGLVDSAISVVLLDLVRSAGGSVEFSESINLPENRIGSEKARLLGAQIISERGLESSGLDEKQISGQHSWVAFKFAV